MARPLGSGLLAVDGEPLDRPAPEVQEEVAVARDREAQVGPAAVGRPSGREIQLEGIGDPADARGPLDRLGPGQDVRPGGGVQTALRQAARSTRFNLGLAVVPGIRPRLAIGRPSISLMSPVKSIGLAPEM